MAATQSLNIVANVSVSVSPVAAASPAFNQGLIVGSSARIPTTDRVRKYTSLTSIAGDGFLTSDPEYIAAQLYFSQVPTPPVLWIGRQDLTATETPLAALTACRAVCPNWWACYVTSAVSADHAGLAGFVQGSSAGRLLLLHHRRLRGARGHGRQRLPDAQGAERTIAPLACTQRRNPDRAPNNVSTPRRLRWARPWVSTPGLANSNFTMKFKQLAGVQYESITPTQVSNIENCELQRKPELRERLTRGSSRARCASGKFLDEVLGIDALAADLQYSPRQHADFDACDPALERRRDGAHRGCQLGAANGRSRAAFLSALACGKGKQC
jgi:hypothetical protein